MKMTKLNDSVKSNLISLDGGDSFMYLGDYCKLSDEGTISDIEHNHGCLIDYLNEKILSEIIRKRMDKYGHCSVYEYLKDYLRITKKNIVVNWKKYADCNFIKLNTIRCVTFQILRGRFYIDEDCLYSLK
jgi:hypothetical protein